jgi:pimeloyl-ACP methyl ester carboxylesterase
MNTADSLRGYDDLRSPEVCANNEPWIPARVLLQFPFFAPGSHAKNVTCPIYFAVCETDSVCPPLPSIEYAKKAPRGRCKVYKGIGHFDIYLGKHFEVAVEDYIRFYDEVV